MLDNLITRADRAFIALHKAGRISSGRERVYHAVTPHCRIALCSDEPGASSGWAARRVDDMSQANVALTLRIN